MLEARARSMTVYYSVFISWSLNNPRKILKDMQRQASYIKVRVTVENIDTCRIYRLKRKMATTLSTNR